MTEINLLPWREKQRELEKKLFTSLLLTGVVAAVVIVFLINSYANHLIDNQNTRNQTLQKEITVLDGQIRQIKQLKKIREGLISRMSIIQNLQSTRTVMVHLFDELIKVTPSGIYVTKLERKNDVVTLWGFTESNTNVSMLMRAVEENVWIHSPVLTEIKKLEENTSNNKKIANNEFKLSFVLKPKFQVK